METEANESRTTENEQPECFYWQNIRCLRLLAQVRDSTNGNSEIQHVLSGLHPRGGRVAKSRNSALGMQGLGLRLG